MGVEVSHDDVVIMEVKKMVKVSCEIMGTTGYRGYVNIVNVLIDNDNKLNFLQDGSPLTFSSPFSCIAFLLFTIPGLPYQNSLLYLKVGN